MDHETISDWLDAFYLLDAVDVERPLPETATVVAIAPIEDASFRRDQRAARSFRINLPHFRIS